MKTAIFSIDPSASAIVDRVGADEIWSYPVPTLSAYAIVSHHVDGVLSIDGHPPPPCAIDDDRIAFTTRGGWPPLQSIGLPMRLVVQHLGIRDYEALFPQVNNESLKTRLGSLMEEADKAFESGAWLSFAVMAGAVLEGVLLDLSGKSNAGLHELIEIATERAALQKSDKAACDAMKKARNLIHAARHADPMISRANAFDTRLTLDELLKRDWRKIKTTTS